MPAQVYLTISKFIERLKQIHDDFKEIKSLYIYFTPDDINVAENNVIHIHVISVNINAGDKWFCFPYETLINRFNGSPVITNSEMSHLHIPEENALLYQLVVICTKGTSYDNESYPAAITALMTKNNVQHFTHPNKNPVILHDTEKDDVIYEYVDSPF